MRALPSGLRTWLDTTSAGMWSDLYLITLQNGAQIAVCDYEQDITANGVTYHSLSDTTAPLVQCDEIKHIAGTATSTVSLTLHCSTIITLGGIPMVLAAAQGAFRNATVLVQRQFMAYPGDSSFAPSFMFEGYVTKAGPNRMSVRLEVASMLDRLNIPLPKNTYQAACSHVLGDAGCTVNLATLQCTGTVGSGATTSVIPASLSGSTSGQASGYFDLGTIAFTSGANAGASRSVQASAAGWTITAAVPFLAAPSPGDAFIVKPGCDRSIATCRSKFSNDPHFHAFPFVPAPESLT